MARRLEPEPRSELSSRHPREAGARVSGVDLVALVGAVVAHVALFGGARLLPPVETLLGGGAGKPAELELVSVDVSDEKPPAPAVERVPTEPTTGAVEPRRESAEQRVPRAPTKSEAPPKGEAPRERAALIAPAPAPVAVGDGPTAAGPTAADPAPAAAGPRGEATAPRDEYDQPPQGPAPRGLASMLGAPAWAIPGAITPDVAAPAPTAAPQRAPVDPDVANRVISSTLRSRDKKAFVDVPAASTVAGTVATTMRSVAVPHNTRATFEVKLGPGGKVLGARVLSSTGGDATQWDAAAKSVASSLSKQTLSLGAEAEKTGVTVKVVVTQKHVFPSGTAKGADIRPKCANGFINDIVDAADKAPRADLDPKVPLFQDEHGRPCIPVGVAGVSDVANIGAQKQIQVESSFQVIIPGQVDLPAEIHEVNTEAPWIERGKEGPRPTLPQKVRKYMRDKEKKK